MTHAESAESLDDALVVGGSYAGIAAALQLARARRSVAVLDSGSRRNRFATASHGFLGHDGKAPGAIVAEAREQLLAYPTVRWAEGSAISARQERERGFVVRSEDGRSHRARLLVLATGVTDELPDVPGLRERWGESVFHCPYCHGYELGGGPVGVFATGPLAEHHALLLPDWGPTTLFTNHMLDVDEELAAKLRGRGVSIEPVPVAEIHGEKASVRLEDGRSIELAGLFVTPRTRQSSPLAEQLGCEFADGPTGPYIATDQTKATSVPGVFACGDAALAMSTVSFAVADGALAGTAAHRSLIFG